jgi:hypothetical protein
MADVARAVPIFCLITLMLAACSREPEPIRNEGPGLSDPGHYGPCGQNPGRPTGETNLQGDPNPERTRREWNEAWERWAECDRAARAKCGDYPGRPPSDVHDPKREERFEKWWACEHSAKAEK